MMSEVIEHNRQNIWKDAARDAPVRAVRVVEGQHLAVAVDVRVVLGAEGVGNFQNRDGVLSQQAD
jgi:hypothetical protein